MTSTVPIERCRRCILAEDFPHITFDQQGVCNYCHAWDTRWKNFDYERAEQKLRAIFDFAMSKKRRYDCLIPYSGGRDSSYVVYLCKKKYGLNPLLVTFNNLFMSDYALKNIFSTVEQLGVDHVFASYKPDLLKRFYASMVRGGGEFCSVCTAGINYVTITYQQFFRIPLVISGTSTRVDEQSPFEVTSTHPLYVKRVLDREGFTEPEIDAFLIKRPYEAGLIEKVKMKLLDTDHLRINLPDYVVWNNFEIQRVLEEELSWKTPDRQKDHIDCKFAPVKYYLKNKQIPHYIFTQEKYSQLIRDGQMTREGALRSLETLLAHEIDEPVELEDFMRFLNLDRKDIDNKEQRSHRDYLTKEELIVKESMAYRVLAWPWHIHKRFLSSITTPEYKGLKDIT